ncbi:hypothetical protein [Mycobacterium antarcticum]|uniref:hypothetical protein n=1 Tax=Mycolicibacterium sp. TUM20984 TaxID=3023368 RepID=UPI0024E05CA4|nr:hypothetical protein [Mycolicibacterium sp. TUM20984]
MRIRTGTGNDIYVVPRKNGGVAIEQRSSHILINAEELRLILDALHVCADDFQPPRIQRFANGVEQF